MSIFNKTLPTPEDIRAARAYVGWTQSDLGKLCDLSAMAIANIEKRKFNPSPENLEKIQKAFLEADIEFLQNGGFQPRKDIVEIIEGPDCYLELLDTVYRALYKKDGEILTIGVDERKSTPAVIEARKRIIKSGIKSRFLIEKDNYYILGNLDNYRWTPKEYFTVNDVTLVYEDKVAYVTTRESIKRIIILKDNYVAANYRNMFNFMWEAGTKPTHSEVKSAY